MSNLFYQRDVVSIADLDKAALTQLFALAKQLKAEPQPTLLKHRIIASCFYEPSTRTRLSFEAAALRQGGQVIGFSDAKTSAGVKGESLTDAMKIIAQYADAIVVRHPQAGAARLAADVTSIPVINAGDGANQHPTQTLLDLFSIEESQGHIDGLHLAFVGDLKYGRTIHSLVQACSLFDVRCYFISSEGLSLPESIIDFMRNNGVRYSFHKRLDEIIQRVDILYMTRLQKERFYQADFISGKSQCVLTKELLQLAKDNLKVLHPLPRNEEIEPAVDETPYAYYFEQASNGLYIRQALLSLLLNEHVEGI